MADEGLVEDSGEEASPDTQVAEPTEAVQQDSEPVSEAASDETPAEEASAEKQQEPDANEKRVNDTLSALKEAQRELHETKGQLKEIHTRVEAARKPPVDPQALRKQREEMADQLGITPEALEYVENLTYGQQLAFDQRLEDMTRSYQEKLDTLDPVYQKHQSVVEKLSNDPMFQGWTVAQIAHAADKFSGVLGGPTQPTPPKPPATSPAGTGRRSQSSKPKDGFTDAERAWINAGVDGEEADLGLVN